MNSNFHMSLPCLEVENTKAFYINTLGLSHGRISNNWIDINFFNHQITFTKCGDFKFDYKKYRFEKTTIPSFHFGVILDKTNWNKLYAKVKETNNLYITKTNFLKQKNGEHNSFFIKDPNGYIIEFKCFKKRNEIF